MPTHRNGVGTCWFWLVVLLYSCSVAAGADSAATCFFVTQVKPCSMRIAAMPGGIMEILFL